MAKKNLAQPAPSAGKRIGSPKPAETEDVTPDRPVFCLQYLQNGYDVAALNKDQKAAVLDRLDRMRQMSWKEIILAPRHGNGKEEIATSSLKKPLPQGVAADVTIWALRCFGLMPILGFRRKGVFHLIWLDPNGELYDH